MRYTLLISVVFATLSLVACERNTVTTPTPDTMVVPDPAGPTSAPGATGTTGDQGTAAPDMAPPASAPTN